MRRVEIYEDCNEIVAHLPGVRRHITSTTRAAARRASAKLAARRSGESPHSSIEWEVGITDGYVHLVDPEGGAISIEFGRTGSRGKGGPSQGVHALQGIW